MMTLVWYVEEYMNNGKVVMVRQCPVAVLVLCSMTDPACQSYGKSYTGL
jgi:hypothetical protein